MTDLRDCSKFLHPFFSFEEIFRIVDDLVSFSSIGCAVSSRFHFRLYSRIFGFPFFSWIGYSVPDRFFFGFHSRIFRIVDAFYAPLFFSGDFFPDFFKRFSVISGFDALSSGFCATILERVR